MSAWLLDTLVYTGALIALVLLLRRPVGRLFGPQIAYALWALPFLRLLLPPIVLPASFAPGPEAAGQAEPVVSAATQPWILAEMPAETPVATPPAVPAAAAWEWGDWLPVAVSLWAGVALAFLAWRVVTYRRMRQELLKGARPVGEVGKVRLVETPAVAAPVAFGVFDKVIALPPLFMAQHDIVARDLAIEHEFAHHKGQDLLANMAAQALLALHWFNPLAWYGWRAMRRDQEAACDARVIAGKTNAERLRYAALIAGVATGPRPIAFQAALAAPMACPVLGERSIVHRLRSLSMSELSRRRRWLGRTFVGVGALALPLTASISYAAANAEPTPPTPPASPVPPAPLSAELPPRPPAPPGAPAAAAAVAEPGSREVRTIVLRDGQTGREPPVREFSLRRDGALPMPTMPRLDFDASGNPVDAEFEARMEEFGRAMERWGEEFGETFAAQAEAQALAWVDAANRAPEVVQSCDPSERRALTTADGRPRIVICEREITARAQAGALAGLRGARAAIAGNGRMSGHVQREILEDLDSEIARLESDAR